MKYFCSSVLTGAFKGLKTALMLLRIMLPIYILVVFLKYTPLFDFLADKTGPAMKLFNLPPDGVVPIIAGAFGDEYAVVAALSGFDFSKAAITTIAMFALAFHGLPLETAITKQIGMPAWRIALFRFGLAIFTGVFVGWLGGLFL